MIIEFFCNFKLNIGFPIFPQTFTLNLFFFNKCSKILQVVDFPLVPVTTIDLIFLFKI